MRHPGKYGSFRGASWEVRLRQLMQWRTNPVNERTCVHACMHACMLTCIHVCVHACIHTYELYMHACIHTNFVTYTCMHAYIHTCMHRCMHAYIHTSSLSSDIGSNPKGKRNNSWGYKGVDRRQSKTTDNRRQLALSNRPPFYVCMCGCKSICMNVNLYVYTHTYIHIYP